MNRIFKIVYINFIFLFILLLLLELFFGSWVFKKNNLHNLGIPKDVKFKYSCNLYGDSSQLINYTRDKYGLRGKSSFNAPHKINILTVGGSTTDQRYIDDNHTWQENLQTMFKNKIISNAGIDGHSTAGHITAFYKWFFSIKNLKPDFILFYIGVNDVFIKKNKKVDVSDFSNQFDFSNYIKSNSAIYSIYRKTLGVYNARIRNVGHKKIDFTLISYTNQMSMNEDQIKYYKFFFLKGFRNRIKELIYLSKRLGARPIFITQPAYYYKYEKSKILGVSKKIYVDDSLSLNGVDYHYVLSMQNKEIKKLIENPKFAVNLADTKIFDDSDFYDFTHSTKEGSKKISNLIFNEINSIIDE